MSNITLSANAGGTGIFTIASPSSNTNRTLNLPDQSGTFLTTGGAISVNASAPVPSVSIDSAGNVGLTTNGSAFQWNSSGNNCYIAGSSGVMSFATGTSGYVERMRIDSGGYLYVNRTSNTSTASQVAISYNANAGIRGLGIQATVQDLGTAIQFINAAGTVCGTIVQGTSTTTYNTSSDYRLKDNIASMTGALAKVAALKPVTYKWKADGSDGQGFIAHELQEVVPECVTGEKDAVNEDGNPVYQGIDTSFLVATLTAALQEQQALIQSLTQRIAALEGAA